MSLSELFKPITVGSIELRNRMVMAAVNPYLGDAGVSMRRAQWVSAATKRWYEERAKGGVGLIVTGNLTATQYYPDDEPPYFLGVYGDRFMTGLMEMVETVHEAGAPIMAQVNARGFAPLKPGGPVRMVAGAREPAAPVDIVSASDAPIGRVKPRALSVTEIQEILELWGRTARYLRGLGFDGICVNMGVAGLENLFISPLSNKRTDDYGGSLENRMRFPIQVVESIKKGAGRDWTILARVGASDFMEGGLTIEDTKQYAPMLAKAGVDAISVIGGWHISPVPIFQASVPRGVLADMAWEIKKVVPVPVAASHRINDPEVAERILAGGKADLVELGRALIADPEFANKAREGRLDDIRKCIACGRCLDNVMRGTPIRCTVNPRAGREVDYNIQPAPKGKRVLVVGGGIAGLEVASLAARKGHRVTLLEKQERLGGQLLVATQAPHKDELKDLLKHLVAQVQKAEVEVKLGVAATAGSIVQQKPDAVVLASGARPRIPEIPGAGGSNVATAIDILSGARDTGKNVVVVGGGAVGCETAEFLAGKGRAVTIVEMLARIGQDITPSDRWVVMQRLRKLGVRMETGARVEEITGAGVRVSKGGQAVTIPCDTVVLAVGMQPVRELYDALKGKVEGLYLAGDCLEPQRIGEALESAFRIAMRV